MVLLQSQGKVYVNGRVESQSELETAIVKLAIMLGYDLLLRGRLGDFQRHLTKTT